MHIQNTNLRAARNLTLAVALATFLAQPLHCAPLPMDEETEQLLVDAVESAAALDFYNARCRSDRSGRHTGNLNKEIVGKLRMTVISIQDDLFPERGYRQAQQRMQEQFLTSLKEAGGCKGAKQSGLAEALRERFREQLEAVEALP